MLPDFVPPLSAGACHDVMIRISNPAGNMIETQEHAGQFKEW
jgi:hypothetical protein